MQYFSRPVSAPIEMIRTFVENVARMEIGGKQCSRQAANTSAHHVGGFWAADAQPDMAECFRSRRVSVLRGCSTYATVPTCAVVTAEVNKPSFA